MLSTPFYQNAGISVALNKATGNARGWEWSKHNSLFQLLLVPYSSTAAFLSLVFYAPAEVL